MSLEPPTNPAIEAVDHTMEAADSTLDSLDVLKGSSNESELSKKQLEKPTTANGNSSTSEDVIKNESTNNATTVSAETNETIEIEPAASSLQQEDTPAASCNPSMSDDEVNAEDLERIKGDAIGDTLYSERFVLSTLLKLNAIDSSFEMSNDKDGFENDLCAIWDMTIEQSVVDLMLEHSILELFGQCIQITQDKRLTEVLVGIIGNMCAFERARLELAALPEVIGTLLQLFTCTDTLTLVQLMRLLSVVLIYDDPSEVHLAWYKQIQQLTSFNENFTFVLENSANIPLLTHAMEALNAILAKFLAIHRKIEEKKLNDLEYSDIFLHEPLILSTMVAFKVLVPQQVKRHRMKKNRDTPSAASSEEEPYVPTQSIRKTMQIFLNIHVIFVQFREKSTEEKERHLKHLLPCVSQILEPLCVPQCLLPLSSSVQDVLENVDEIILAFGDPFNDRCFSQMLTIWYCTHNYATSRLHSRPANDFEADADDDDDQTTQENAFTEDILMTVLVYITRTVRKATEKQLVTALRTQQPKTIAKLIDALSHGESEHDIRECREKLIRAYNCLITQDVDASELQKRIEEKKKYKSSSKKTSNDHKDDSDDADDAQEVDSTSKKSVQNKTPLNNHQSDVDKDKVARTSRGAE